MYIIDTNVLSPDPVNHKGSKPPFSIPALTWWKIYVWALIVDWVLPPTSSLGFKIVS